MVWRFRVRLKNLAGIALSGLGVYGAGDPPPTRFEMGSSLRDSGGGEVSLELRERGKDAQRQLVDGSSTQSRCRHHIQRDAVLLKLFEQGCKVLQIRRFRDSRSRRWITSRSMPPGRFTSSNR